MMKSGHYHFINSRNRKNLRLSVDVDTILVHTKAPVEVIKFEVHSVVVEETVFIGVFLDVLLTVPINIDNSYIA